MTNPLTTSATITYGNVEAWFEMVGPERAAELLKSYKVDYRKFRPSYADGLARDMANGHWNFDGATVRIDDENNLFDGQHRLNSVMSSGEPQLFLFVKGIPVKAYDTTDTGLARTYGDTLRRRGYQNVSARTALMKLINRWETGKSLDDTKRLTNSEMDDILDRHVDTINRAVQMSMSTSKKMHLPGALVAFSWWILSQIDSERAYTFLVSVAEGENIRRGQAAYTLRERLRNDYEAGYSRNEYMHLVFSAWNAYIRDEEIGRLVMPKGFVTRQSIVTPIGPKTVTIEDEEEARRNELA